ncbi:MAG: hypothetical protein GY769_01815 [bacterium]|nr:hypothetical protein [bacterium]
MTDHSTHFIKQMTGAKYEATIRDADGVAIPLAQLTTIALTLYNVADNSIINSRDAQDVKNTNNVTIHATSGLLTWLIQEADNPIVDPVAFPIGESEPHVALFEFTYAGDGTPGKHEIVLMVRNLGQVP